MPIRGADQPENQDAHRRDDPADERRLRRANFDI